MTRRKPKSPCLGPAFDVCRMNMTDRPLSYVGELRYYRPRGFSALAREGERIARMLDSDHVDGLERFTSWADDVESLLTSYGQRVDRNPYLYFGPFPDSGDVGFYVDVENAQGDADLTLDSGDCVPKGFSGMAVFVTDHGNVTAQNYSRGRMTRELFAVV